MDLERKELSSLDSAFGIYWDECQSINSQCSHHHDIPTEDRKEESKDDEIFGEDNDDIQWLSDIGLACVVGKYKDHAQIDTNDAEFQSITSTLTRRQSATVRKRIESLNDTWKKMKKESSSRHVDVRSIFPAKTDGQSTRSLESTSAGKSNQHQLASSNHKTEESGFVLAMALPGISHANSYFYSQTTKPSSFSTVEQHHTETSAMSSVQAQRENCDRSTGKCHRTTGLSTGHGQSQSTWTSTIQSQTSLSPDKRQELSDYRQAIDKNMNMFYSTNLEQQRKLSRSPQPVHTAKIRPPPPRRAKSEDAFKVQGVSSVNCSDKLRKSPSAGSPVHNKDLATYAKANSSSTYLSPSANQPSKSHPSRSLDIDQLSSPRSGPQRREAVTKHKSEEDLSRLRARDRASDSLTSNNIRPEQKISQHAIDGDAKLNIGSDSTGTTQCLFNGQAFPSLPNFSLKPEKTGMTRIHDLSEEDMTKVRSLALIELTALFDNCGIAMNRRKHISKYKQNDSVIFGVALPLMQQRDYHKESDKPELQAPRFFKHLIAYLEKNSLHEEGLLRVSGSQQRIKILREELEEAYSTDYNFNWKGRQTRDLATVLKQFLRELPIPLLTHEYQQTFVAVSGLKNRKLQLQALNLLVLLMPPVYRDTLLVLLKFLAKVVQYDKENKMDLSNVSMIMAPNLFLQASTRANANEIQRLAATTDVMRMLIKYYKIIWMVPDFMVTQIRYLHEAGSKIRDAKAVKKIIAKRLKSETVVNQSKQKINGSGDELDFVEVDDEPIIRVKAPMFNKTCMAIQLTEDMTASDVIARFRSKRNSIKELTEISRLTIGTNANRSRSDSDLDRIDQDSLTLYEVGGNIGERRLDPNTNIVALLRVNPNAEWVLKFKTPL